MRVSAGLAGVASGALLRKCQPSGILPVSQPSAQENSSGKRSQTRRNVTASGPMELLLFKLGQGWRAGAATGMRESCSAFTRSFCATAAACRGWRSAVRPASLPSSRSSGHILNCVLSYHRKKETSNITVLDWFISIGRRAIVGNATRTRAKVVKLCGRRERQDSIPATASRCDKHRHPRPASTSAQFPVT